MNKVSMRIDYTLSDRSFEDQIRLAAESGVDALEMGDLKDYDCKRAADLAEKAGIHFEACGFYDLIPARIGMPYPELKGYLEKTIECAKIFGVTKLLTMTNDCEVRDAAAVDAFVENFRPAVELCGEQGLDLLLEPHATKYNNPVADMSHYFLNTSALAYEVIEKLNAPNVKVLFDVYHCQTMEGDVLMNIQQHLPLIRHFHLAGVPGRDEPTNGEINYVNLVHQVSAWGYDEYFGLEYYPTDLQDLDTLANIVSLIKNA